MSTGGASSRKQDMRREESIWAGNEPRELADGSDTPVEVAEASEALDRLRELVPEGRRTVLDLKAEGLTTVEIAARLGLGERTVRRVIEDLRRRAGIDWRRGGEVMPNRPDSDLGRGGVAPLRRLGAPLRRGLAQGRRRATPIWPATCPKILAPGRRRSSRCFAPTWRSVARPATRFASSRIFGAFRSCRPTCSIALVYEEYCVRQEAGEALDPREFDSRFPAIAAEVRDLIDIHKFVDSSQDLLLGEEPAKDDALFPRAGETIGGFRLVEELGRGRLARVFLALERHLADRQVALKVSRKGSREPQTLAILQHTHIVPDLLVSRRRRHGPSFALHALFRQSHAG